MKCPICGNQGVKKIFISGRTFEDGKQVACDVCQGKTKAQKPPKGSARTNKKSTKGGK